MIDFHHYSILYKQELLQQVVPFWQRYSIDKQFGGFYTCLDQKGNVFDTDKFVWLQGRQTWMFSMLYNQVEQKQQWLDIALHGADFLIKHGRDQQGLWYFSLTRQGKPLVQPFSIFSDCFAAMAFAELYKSTKKEQYKKLAKDTFYNILKRQQNPQGKWSKGANGRKLINFTLPMILCNLSPVLQHVIGTEQIEAIIKPIIEMIMTKFLDKQHNIFFQNRGPNGEFVDCFEGRVINAGHGNQAIWFILDLAERFKDKELQNKCTDILINTTKFAWDDKYGGIFYFKDIKGYPVQQLEWDQKLWWVHIQTMISFLKAYKMTGRQECLEWFKKLHDYTWEKFRDNENKGEWWGYLNRQGQVSLRLKGGKWKGCFHVPRGLYQLYKTCDQLKK